MYCMYVSYVYGYIYMNMNMLLFEVVFMSFFFF
uniref:Uncharacterized protein n=1 Tax=Anguilla anguilla TaxID=7936 RepID=A0A0E9RUF9_ANGAN